MNWEFLQSRGRQGGKSDRLHEVHALPGGNRWDRKVPIVTSFPVPNALPPASRRLEVVAAALPALRCDLRIELNGVSPHGFLG